MYYAFTRQVHIDEIQPPSSQEVIWIQTVPESRLVPTTKLYQELGTSSIPESVQPLSIYKFTTTPEIKVYSPISNSWEVTEGGYILISVDNCMLVDIDGIHLITKKGIYS